MALIEVRNLTKEYRSGEQKRQHVLKGLSLSMNSGEFIAIIGESGSGKSTLLNIIGGLDSDYEGRVIVRARNQKEFTSKELDDYRKLNIGFVFQSFNLIPTYTVLENILAPADMTNMQDKIKKEKAAGLISKLGLSGLEDKLPSSLSGGEKQRVAIARALINDPDIILADEPTGALDKKNAGNIIALLKSIASEGKLVVVVTHSQKVADNCDRVVRIEYGVISQDSGLSGKAYPEKEKVSERVVSKNLGFIHAFSTAYKNIRKNRLRNVLVSMGTGIGIFSVVALLFLSSGIGRYVTDQMYSQTNPLLVEVSKQRLSDSPGRRFAAFSHLEPFNENDISKLSEIDGVALVEKGSMISGSTTFTLGNKNESIAMLSTVNNSFSPDLKIGSMPETGQILINESIAKATGENHDKLIGKEIILKIEADDAQAVIEERVFTICGIIENDGSPASSFKIAYIHFKDLEAMDDGQSALPANMLYLTAADQRDVEHIKSEAAELGFSSSSRDSALNRIISFINTITIGLTGVAAVSLVVSGIMILVVLFISVVERTKEIGTLRAIGARMADIRNVFVCEGVLLGLGSGIIGIMLAVIVSGVANRILYRITGVHLIAVNLPNILTGIMISVGISMLASLIPAAKASKLDPVESLRHE